jgi:hypothetical protein
MIRTYTELSRIETFEERYRYLALKGEVGYPTFGFDRYLNQKFYTSREWRNLRRQIIIRDNGCDLGLLGYEIHSGLVIHHINPMTVVDIAHKEDSILDPEFLITTSYQTHNAIHFGDEKLLPRLHVDRSSGDTKLW